jgi:hypothetical protein
MLSPSVITIECCGLLVGSTSEEIADHIRASWVTGQECIDLVRAELGPVLADIHAPITKGGVQLHKLQGVMHDTCNTANKTARLAKTLRETSGQLFYGYDEWEDRAEEDKPWFDFLCGNHTRNLPMDEFNKVKYYHTTMSASNLIWPHLTRRNLNHIYAAHLVMI